MNKAWKIIIPVVVLMGGAGIGIAIWHAHLAASTAPATEAAAEAPPEPGEVELKPEQVEASGIKTTELAVTKLAPEVRFFGVLQEDPAATFTLRSPGAGTVVADPAHPWPEIGAMLEDKATVGTLEFRLAASDRISLDTQRTTLESQHASAQSDLTTATASLAAAKASYERLKSLNAEDKNVSDRAVEEALVKLQAEEAHLAGASKTLEAVQAALGAIKGKMEPVPLTVERGGQVVEMLAQPGESVESGQSLLRVARFNQLLASVDIPAEQEVPAKAAEARIFPLGREQHLLSGTRVGAGATADPKTHGQTLLFRLKLDEATLRPGTPITAYLPTGEPELEGVIVPTAAVVRYLGKTWAYRQVEENVYHRTEVNLDHPVEGGYFVTQELTAGDDVVTVGAQVILNAEVAAAGG